MNRKENDAGIFYPSLLLNLFQHFFNNLRSGKDVWQQKSKGSFFWVSMPFLSGNPDLRDTQGVSHGNDAMGSTLHWGPYWPLNGYEKTTKEQWVSLLLSGKWKTKRFQTAAWEKVTIGWKWPCGKRAAHVSNNAMKCLAIWM